MQDGRICELEDKSIEMTNLKDREEIKMKVNEQFIRNLWNSIKCLPIFM